MSHKDNILTYLESARRGKESNELERKAHNDAFLNDALDGFTSVNNDKQSLDDINKLQRMLLSRTKKRSHSNIFRFIATSAAVLLVFITGYWFLQKNEKNQQLAVMETTLQQDSTIEKDIIQQNNIEKSPVADNTNEETLPVESPKSRQAIINESVAKQDNNQEAKTTAIDEIQMAEEDMVFTNSKPVNYKSRDENKLVNPMDVKQFDQTQYSNRQSYVLGQSQGDLNNTKLIVGQLAANQSLYSLSSPEQSNALDGKLFNSKQNQSFLDNNYKLNNNQNISQSQYYSFTLPQNHTNNINNQFNRQIAQNQVPYQSANNTQKEAKAQIATEETIDEAIVTGYATKRETAVNSSITTIINEQINSLNEKELQPVIGMDKYQEYLKTNLIYPVGDLEKGIKGKVTLSFLVGSDGIPYDIKIEKSLSEDCDKEAIRLVLQGSKWNPSNKDSQKRIKLKINFEQ